MGFSGGLDNAKSAFNAGNTGSSWSGEPPGEGGRLPLSILAGESVDRGPGSLQSRGLRAGHNWAANTHKGVMCQKQSKDLNQGKWAK